MRVLRLIFASALLAPGALAQSIVTGAVAGEATDQLGRPLTGAHVILIEATSLLERDVETESDGRFEFTLIPAGRYDLLVEALGYEPTRVVGIPVGAGRRIAVPVSLNPIRPPVTDIRTLPFAAAPVQRIGQDGGRLFDQLELRELPLRTRELAELSRFASTSSEQQVTEGLPGRYSGVVVDGLAFQSAGNPSLPQPEFPTAVFALSSLSWVELLSSGVDVEYGGFPSASLVGFSRRGGDRFAVSTFGDWSGDALSGSSHFDASLVSHSSLRGGLTLGGPIVSDSAHFLIGVEARRLETPMPRPWEAGAFDTSLVTVAADSFGVDLSMYLQPRVVSTDMLSGYGNVDWQLGARSALTVRVSGSTLESRDPELGMLRIPARGVELKGTDLSGLVSLTSSLSGAVALEARIGAEMSTREYTAGEFAATVLVDGPAALGTDPVLPGDFQRFAVRATEALHLRLGQHRIKVGGAATVSRIDDVFVPGQEGGFIFGNVDDFARLDGAFVQSSGQATDAQFTTMEFAGFLQDTWIPVPGLSIKAGIRLDVELLPEEDVVSNSSWFDVTGLANTDFESTILKFSPRIGVLADRGRWQARADFTVHHGSVANTAFPELVGLSGSSVLRRGIGQLGRWPESPETSVAPVVGPTLSLLGPDFRPPRSARASVGFAALVAAGVRLGLSAAYRHTDFLPRRHDVNLVLAAAGADQFDRPVYGRLVQRGSLLGAEPGSNRRFTGFDVVSALDPDGYSDYWGISAMLERRVAGLLSFFAGYTYSRTEDNWLSGLGGEPGLQLTPFPDSLGNADWAEGRSDFDVPHVMTLGAELDFGPVRLAGFLRGQSGRPFTPGFRDGVDANGDGSFRNDPAFIDNQVPGISDVLSEWECLRTQVGAFAERNSCRGPAVRTFDMRLTVSPFRLGSYPVQLVVDGLNLIEPEAVEVDRAVYLIDASSNLTTDAATGRFTVPLVANPNFGQPIVRHATGRAVRIGLRVNHD